MLSLDQVRLLENRVEKAVSRIQELVSENTTLREQLSGFQSRISELEGLVRAFKDDQGRIEEGILSALDRLSAFEDTLQSAQHEGPSTEEIEKSSAIEAAATEIMSTVEADDLPEEDLFGESKPVQGLYAQSNTVSQEVLKTEIEADWEIDSNQGNGVPLNSTGQMDIF